MGNLILGQEECARVRPVAGGRLSPLVERSRGKNGLPEAGSDEHWSVLIFESLSVGTMVVLVVMLGLLVVVGVYVILVWPLTFWDLADVGLENYGSWLKTVLWSVFAGGSLAGYWCVSGAAFKPRPARKGTGGAVRGAKSTRR